MFKKPTIFLERAYRDIHTIPFRIHVGNIGQANIDLQFILDPYTSTSYCISNFKNKNKIVTQKLN
jgi:hypothetical protein